MSLDFSDLLTIESNMFNFPIDFRFSHDVIAGSFLMMLWWP